MKIKILLYYKLFLNYFLTSYSVLSFRLIPEKFQVPIEKNENEELYKIYLNFKKKELLKCLENNNLDTLQKMEKINYFNKYFKDEIMIPNMTCAGLMDDWDFEID